MLEVSLKNQIRNILKANKEDIVSHNNVPPWCVHRELIACGFHFTKSDLEKDTEVALYYLGPNQEVAILFGYSKTNFERGFVLYKDSV